MFIQISVLAILTDSFFLELSSDFPDKQSSSGVVMHGTDIIDCGPDFSPSQRLAFFADALHGCTEFLVILW